MWKRVAVVIFGLLVAAAPAKAQDDKPVGVNFGFGPSMPTSGFKDSFDTGWTGSLGVTYNIKPTVGIQAEYMYNRFGGPSRTISISDTPALASLTNGLLESNQQIHALTFNVVGRSRTDDKMVGMYGLGGLGWYHRIIQLTSPSVGYTTFCDPYWYVCYPAAVSVDTIIGDRSSNDFGINFGGGVTFGHSSKFYVEARYHYVWGPTITPQASQLPAAVTPTPVAAGTTYKTNGSYFPITFGVRW